MPGEATGPIARILGWQEPLTPRQRRIQRFVRSEVAESLSDEPTLQSVAESFGTTYRSVRRWLDRWPDLQNTERRRAG